MILEVEGRSPIESPSPEQVKSAIMILRSYGPSSFASLMDHDGGYLQVAGGGVTCMIERRMGDTGLHFRGYKKERSPVFEDGTVLSFGGGEIKMNSDEWMTSADVEDVFLSFLARRPLPSEIMWRDITDIFEE